MVAGETNGGEYDSIRQAAQRNAMTETDAMALALEAEHAPNR